MTDQTLNATPLPIEAPPPASSRKILAAFDNAWRRFNAFDDASKLLKTRYKRVRWYIIIVSFATTLAAVIDARFSPDNDDLALLMRGLLVVLPLFSAAVLTYAARFEGGNGWVGFRVAAETIKFNIYELRLKRHLDAVTMEDLEKLAKVIEKTDEQIEGMGVTVPIEINLIDEDNESKDAKQLTKPNDYAMDYTDDDGYTPLSIDDYLRLRVLPQAEWYNKKAVADFKKTRMWRGVILAVGILGPALAAFGQGYLVAVTVAAVNGLVAFIGLQQYEQNYGIYSKTARQLENLVNQLEPKIDLLTSADLLEWIRKIETVFASEREMWQLTVLRGQSATEEVLTQLVNSRTNVLQNSDLGKLLGGPSLPPQPIGTASSQPSGLGPTRGVPTSYPGQPSAQDTPKGPPSYPMYPSG
jgi:hypothetical protein